MKNRIIGAVLGCTVLISSFPAVMPLSAAAYGIQSINFDYSDDIGFEPIGSAKLALSNKMAHSGERSLLVSNRTSVSDGAVISVESTGAAASYDVTVWVNSDGAGKLTATLGGQKVNSANMIAGSWIKLSGRVNIESDADTLDLKICGLKGTDSFYIDDVSVLADGQELTTPYLPEGVNALENGDFESGVLEPFAARGCTNTVTAASAHDGKLGVSVTDRTQSWNGIEYNIKDLLVHQCSYAVSAWFRLDDKTAESAEYYMQLEISEDGYDTRYPGITKFTAKSGEWVQVTGIFSTSEFAYPVSVVKLYFASADDNLYDFSIDDVSLAYTTKRASGYNPRPADAHPWVNTELTPIKDVYKDHFLIGSARSSATDEEDTVEDDFIAYHNNVVTLGNAMKPDAIENRKGILTYDTADYLLEESAKRGVAMHGHVLCWHEQSPAWLNQGDITREEALQNMHDYIFEVMGHFKGKCISWDVVNEAIDGITDTSQVSGILRDTPWRRAIGDDYIEYAFRYAAEADPDVKLYYNDFNLDDARKADAVVTLIKSLLDKGIRVDGIGMQAHYSTTTSITAVENSIKKFAALGVKISVSELDVCHYDVVGSKMTEEQEIEQAQKYAQLMRLYKKYSDVIERVTIWGTDDGTSWRPQQCPLPFDKDYQPKEAYYAILDPETYLEEHPIKAKVPNYGYAYRGTPEIDGKVEELWNDVPEYDVNRYVMAWQGSTAKFKCLWDENYLYVLMDVTDDNLSTVSSETYLQDSVEVFVDENNAKTTSYDADDAQYRVNCENMQSFGTGAIEDKFATEVVKTDHGYLAEMAVPFHAPRTATGVIGFDSQVNDDSKGDGNRTSMTKFCDVTDLSWGSAENWGEMFLTEHGERDAILVNLNGKTLSFDVPPMIINERTMVPFRKIFEALDATVEYDADGQYITAESFGTEIKLQVGSTTAYVNGEAVELDVAPVIVNDRTLVPIRFVAESLRSKVDWNGETGMVSIIPE